MRGRRKPLISVSVFSMAAEKATQARLETLSLSDLNPGEVVVRVAWSGINYKDALAVSGKGRISVRIESPQVSVHGNTATGKFRQVYVSDRLTANTRKTLVLGKHGGKWLIKQESTGN